MSNFNRRSFLKSTLGAAAAAPMAGMAWKPFRGRGGSLELLRVGAVGVGGMGWSDLNWLEDVHLGYEEGRPAVFDRNINGWVSVPEDLELPDNQQERDMIARELLIKFQMSPNHPMIDLNKAYRKF